MQQNQDDDYIAFVYLRNCPISYQNKKSAHLFKQAAKLLRFWF